MKRRFLVFSIVLLLSISFFAFSSSAATSDELLGDWLLKSESSILGYSGGLEIYGDFDFPNYDFVDYIDFYSVSFVGYIYISTEEYISEYSYISTVYIAPSREAFDDNSFEFFRFYYTLDNDYNLNGFGGFEFVHGGLDDISSFVVNSVSLDQSPDNIDHFYEFLNGFYFRSIAAPDPSPYDAIYNLIKFWIFGDNVVAGSFHDLVCIQLSTIAVILFFSIPFIVVFWLIRRVC